MDLPNPHGISAGHARRHDLLDATERKSTVPSTAVVREENKDYVFIQIEPTKFMLAKPRDRHEKRGDDRVLESGVGSRRKIVLIERST